MATSSRTATSKVAVKYIYPLGPGVPPPPLDKTLLGGKGKGLAEMSSMGMLIPPGFIITTEACNEYRRNERHFPERLESEIDRAIGALEKQMNATFGSERSP